MIGNDIVDLNQANKDSNWKRPRFLNKVFTDEEKVIISNVEEQNKMVWLLWSMKEAAYKIYVRQLEKRFFNPKRLVCQRLSETSGIVTIEGERYKTTSLVNNKYIHTIAYASETEEAYSHCFKTDQTSYTLQNQLSRKAVLEAYSKIKKIDSSSITIQKDALGIPHFIKNLAKQKEILSMSHHGHYYGYAIL